MLKNIQKTKDQKGFTIIEVLIVLAIAGLILLIVFLAVPQLQRNSRDTQRKNDVSKLLGAVQEVINNNNGSVTSLTGGSSGNVAAATGTLSYYVPSATQPVISAAPASATNSETFDTVTIWTGAKCSSGQAVAGSARQIAITYLLESGGSAGTKQCTNS